MRNRRRRFQSPKVRLEAGSYKIRYSDLDGKRRTKSLGVAGEITLAEAKRLAQEFLRPINDQREFTRHAGRTIRDAIEKWRASIKPLLRPATARNYEEVFKKLTPLHSCPCNALGRADVQQWVTDLAARFKGSTVRTHKAFLSGFLSTVADWEWIESNPAHGRIRLPADDRSRPNVLTPGQVNSLTQALEPEARTLLLVAVLTGLRRGEIAGLQWDDIDAEGIHVRRSAGRNGIGPTKSRSSKRVVRIGPLLRSVLSQWRTPGLFVFPCTKGLPYDRLYVVMRWQIQPACVALGLPRVHWHALRHTYNTWGRDAGVTPEVMRDLMGHSDVRITLQTYSHVRPTDDAADRIESLLTVPENGTQDSHAVH